jgi:hypothetical protein
MAASRKMQAYRKRRQDAAVKRHTLVNASVTTYLDTGQTIARVDWADGSSTTGDPENTHMQALLARARREGIKIHYGEVKEVF